VAHLTEYDDFHLDEPPLGAPPVEDPDLETIVLTRFSAAPPPPGRGSLTGLLAALIVVSLVVGFGTATLVLNARETGSDAAAFAPLPATTVPGPITTSPSTSTPRSTAPRDPNESVLGGLILRQSDVPTADLVSLLDQGTDLSVPTLDLCNGTYPSEGDRTARRQVVLTDGKGKIHLSTEAVLYRDSAKSVQAFSELQSVASQCPSTPVASPVGEGTATTNFHAAPDAAWPKVASVDRLAYDFTTVDVSTGAASHSVAVYLRRGRALVGVYFAQPDGAQIAVSGRTTIARIVNLFETRLAKAAAQPLGG
jgi:hypothetical protein